jgi:outer membrane murein-binding lipoprotein Lpp
VRLIKGILLGVVVLATSQATARADDGAATEIRLLKAQLKKLEQRVDAQSQKGAEARGKVAAGTPPGTYKAPPSVFDPCAAGKVCYKGVTLTPGGWIDLAGIYRSRNLASDTGSVYAFIPFRQAKNFNAQEARFSARQTRFSLLAEADAGANTHLAGYGEIDFEGAAQTASSVATNSFNPQMRQASVEIYRTDLGLHFLAG